MTGDKPVVEDNLISTTFAFDEDSMRLTPHNTRDALAHFSG
jgi:hypothetical protein